MSKLIDAVSNGSLDKVKALLLSGEDVNQKDDLYGTTALHAAAAKNKVEIAKLLIENNAEIDAEDYNGKTPLHTAAENGSPLVTKILLSNGADKSHKDITGKTPLILAYENSRFGFGVKSGEILLNADNARTKSIFDYFRKILGEHTGPKKPKNTEVVPIIWTVK